MSFVIDMIKMLSVMAVGYAAGYFCRREVLKKQCFTVVHKPVRILGLGIMIILCLESLFMIKMGVFPIMAFNKLSSNVADFLMWYVPFFAMWALIGFSSKSEECIAAESASGTAKTMSPAFEKKLNCALAAFLVLFAVGFWMLVSTENQW